MKLEDILSRMEGVKGGGGQYSAKCPAHDDQRASLSVSTGQDGKILLHCHAGCTVPEILDAMGLKEADLFPEGTQKAPCKPQEARPKVVARYNYTDAQGRFLYQKVRYEGKDFMWFHKKNGRWTKKRDGDPVLYNLPAVAGAGFLYIVEGEKDVETLKAAGIPAVCGADGAGKGKWLPQYTEALRGKQVAVIQDNDEIGKAFAVETANALHGAAASVRLLDLTRIWPELPAHGDTTDIVEHIKDGAVEIVNLAMHTEEWKPTAPPPDSDGWEPPIPFATVETPDFPTESLPGPLAAFVECLADSTQTPEEMAGILSLGILATAFQSKYEVEITPDWREPLCLYTVAIAPPGERKSAVIAALTKPVYEYEAEQREFEAAEIAQNQTERALLEKALQAAQMNATKKKGNFEACKAEALELAAQLARFKDLHPFRLLVDDTTPEKLVDIMDTQGGCITVSSAEGGLFDSLAGRYDRAANFDVYLKGHAGDPVTVDRIGRPPNHIPNPRLTMMLTIQPEVLHGLMDNATFRGRGLCGRFLYALCKSKVGRREISPEPVPGAVKAEYRRFVRHILADNGRGVIRLSPEADRVRKDYAAYIERKLGNEWEFMRDWGGKLVGATVRIAALMHAAEVQGNPADIPISPEVMEGAVKIAEFLGVHAMAAYQMMGADETQEDAKYILRQLERGLYSTITKRDLFRLCRGRFKHAEDIERPLSLLSEYGYIRIEESAREGGGRKPSPQLNVNPAICGHNGQIGQNRG